MQMLELKLAADPAAAGSFTGFASTTDLDRSSDVVEPGAWAQTLAVWKQRGGRVPLLYRHDEPIGAITTATATGRGLEVAGQIAIATPTGAIAYELAKVGGLSLSIGFVIPAGGATVVGNVRHIHAIDLYEISLVPIADNPAAVVSSVKSAKDCKTIREFEHLAREALGLSARGAKQLAAVGWPVLYRDGTAQRRDDAPPGVTAEQVRRALRLS
ncbi:MULTISPECIES: HK97 family phage prohead protease [Rhodanobacter]|uniref:HK97 family phage prohead protease n=1 Tax=Rhodanobacter ginsengiterrae TaxID=2008451 RepID=UPI003CF9BB50